MTTQKFNSSFFSALLAKRMLIGAAIALALIAFFLYGADPNPQWGPYWMVRPLLVVPLAGAVGGAVFHFFEYKQLRGIGRILGWIAGVVIYVIGLWTGFVIGLDGTLWD